MSIAIRRRPAPVVAPAEPSTLKAACRQRENALNDLCIARCALEEILRIANLPVSVEGIALGALLVMDGPR